ncbi:hypothetical protein F5X68DRAFT_40572 [Plectosphaerella plurivora]|uniref:Cytochrome b5 heme-binding domain-containing protein n=1 Tax=Plectosphaerella plurivora TaxID=936078 RepID=A0A9P9A5C7_9PEZI|nr:hypothetical protein F5X68DRAFT_40572 [Plectosphaerella plurivora]
MGYVGYSLIVASVVWVIVTQPPWIHPYLPPFLLSAQNQTTPTLTPNGVANKKQQDVEEESAKGPTINVEEHVAMPPLSIRRPEPPTIAEPEGETEEQTTPKATTRTDLPPVPSFALSSDDTPSVPAISVPEISAPAPAMNPTPTLSAGPSMMAPPPFPSRAMPPPRPPQSSPFLSNSPQVARDPSQPPPKRTSPFLPNSPQVARGPSLPIPNRGGPSSSSLAPPPTHSQAPQKPSRKVLLTPGHSPLDWARISGPNADLRNLPPATPYLKVTPSMLKHYTGRKGKDAWTALGGRVYNITPYVPYHPGGGPELLRCAGRDGTKLFGEVHPWVNYETMLTACLVGLLVPEDEGAVKGSKMDEMD